ncbi:MAG: type II toxin-antitoxin system VapC family toxin [Candidatus Bathyarchaeia archaeon]
MLRKVLDANVIVYSLLEDHPAGEACDRLLRSGRYDFYTTPLTPFEVYFILRRVYNVRREEASSRALSLFDSPLRFTAIGPEDARRALERCVTRSVDANDSLLIQLCLRSEIPSLASDDQRLLKACEEEGVQPQSPLGEEHRRRMQQWEEEKLPPSGLPRLLKRIHGWLGDVNPEAADLFHEATGGLRHPP